MKYIFNRKKIQELIFDFYVSTGIPMVLYDSKMNTVASSSILSDFCKSIRKCHDCDKDCEFSNVQYLKEAEKSQETVYYTCHAGLMETITPIFYEDTIIAYIQIGQFRDEEEVFSTLQNMKTSISSYKLAKGDYEKLYLERPLVSKQKLTALMNITNTIVKSFWSDGLIYANRSMVSVKIEQYIEEHLSEKIYINDLCDKFFLSKNALYKLFQDTFHTTVNGYILEQRIDLSKKLLKENIELNVPLVSESCGFSDYNYFIRTFKKLIGVTPLQYRKATMTK